MIRGRVTDERAVVIPLGVLDNTGRSWPINAVVDTGFTGDVSLPTSTIRRLSLRPLGQRLFTLANGELSVMNAYSGRVLWHERPHDVVVIQSEDAAMIGINLIWGSRVTLEARTDGNVSIEEIT
jgi:clan AA aspartic protease